MQNDKLVLPKSKKQIVETKKFEKIQTMKYKMKRNSKKRKS